MTDSDIRPSPYAAPELYDAMFEAFDFDIGYWLRIAREAGGPVLEAGCGTGRVLLRLLEAGVDAEGIDNAAPMIERLHAKAAARGLTARAVTADLRDFDLPRRYALVFCAFNGFAHFETIPDQVLALESCRRHLSPGGAVVLHMSYPGPAYWSEPDGVPVLEIDVSDAAAGRRLQLWDARTKDPVAQCQRSEMEIREIGADGRAAVVHRFSTRQRWVYLYELELLFRTAGFSRWAVYGGFDEKPLARPDEQMIAWAWR